MPPSNRFPILRLPMVPLELVIKDLTPLDIFFLATASSKIHKHLKRNRTKLEKFQLKRIRNCYFDILQANLVPFNEKVGHCIELKVLDFFSEWDNQNGFFNLKIEGKQYKSRFSERDSKILNLHEIHENAERSPLPQKTISSVVELFTDIFSGQTVYFEALLKEVVLPIIPKYSGVQNLDLFHSDSCKDCHKDCQLTSDELSNLLENLSVENFRLKWSATKGLKYRKSLRYPNMTLYYPRWLTIECLLNMDCVSLLAYGVLLTVKDLKRFLQHWLDGGLEKLDCITLHSKFGELSWSSVLDNIEKKPLQYVEGQMSSWLSHNGWEIKRNDGRRAGVHASDYFVFQVL